VSRQTAVLVLIVVASAVFVGIAATPRQDGGRGPDGTVALRRYLERMNLEVGTSAVPPEPGKGTFFLEYDLRDTESAEKILDWVREGGRLVLATPNSAIAAELGVEAGNPAIDSVLPGARVLRPECGALAGTGVAEVAVARSEPPLEVPRRAESCLPADDGPHLAFVGHGRGQVVMLAGRSPLTNQLLEGRDNALLAYRLFAGFGPVVYGPPIDPDTAPAGTFWESLPGGARAGVATFVLALVVFALVEGRRFGRPVVEQPLSPIPSSQLVGATAGLYQAAGAAGFAAGQLRRGAARRVAARLGMPGNTDVEAVRSAAQSMLDDPALAEALREVSPKDDKELIELARNLNRLEEAVESI
jgi:hypothetical protein